MSEVAEAPTDEMSAGTMLREARESAGLHLAALALSLKVPVRKLEALEEDRYDLLSDAVFVRALASSVCRTLKIDAQPVLQRLPQSAAPRLLDENPGINAPFRAPGDAARPSWLSQLSRPVVLVVIVVLLAALVLIFLPAARTPSPSAAEHPAAPAAPAVAAVIEAPAEPQAVPAAAPENAAPAAAAATQVKAAPTQPQPTSAAAPKSTPTAAKVSSAQPATAAAVVPPALPATPVTGAPAATPAQAAASAPAAPPLKGLVVFKASAPSWVEVIDADGKPILRRLLEAGQSARANGGTLPLSITVGSADATEVAVRGKPFDLKPVSSGNVAHFEVK